MTGDVESTRERILQAGVTEFAARGIAGARVDRIASDAGTNKQGIYFYFGNKDGLFDAVFARRVIEFADSVEFDANDLPGYAGRSFDLYEDNPDTVRLASWYQLERPSSEPLDAISNSVSTKLESIRAAQSAGVLPSDREPIEFLVFVRSVSMAWRTQIPEMHAEVALDRQRRRDAVVAAVRRLVSVC